MAKRMAGVARGRTKGDYRGGSGSEGRNLSVAGKATLRGRTKGVQNLPTGNIRAPLQGGYARSGDGL